MTLVDKELLLMMHLLDDIYKKPKLDIPLFENIDLLKMLKLGIKNNVGYLLVTKIMDDCREQLSDTNQKILLDMLDNGSKRVCDQKTTLLELDSIIPERILFKTYRGYNRIPNDIDVLVTDLLININKLKNNDFVELHSDKHDTLLMKNNVKIHLHDKIMWANSEYLDAELITANYRDVLFSGVNINIPNYEADFLIHVAHINYEPLHFTLSDFLYLCRILPFINWDIITYQIKKFHWIKTFMLTMNIFNNLHNIFYNGSNLFKSIVQDKNTDKKNVLFPVYLPKLHIMNAFIEKRLFIYPLTKIIKVIKILYTGDTYTEYYDPPEEFLLNDNKNKKFNII